MCRKEKGVPTLCYVSIIAIWGEGEYQAGASAEERAVLLIRILEDRHDSFLGRVEDSVPLGAGERTKDSPYGTKGRGKRRSFRFSHLLSPRANNFVLLFFRIPVGAQSLLKRAHREFIVILPRKHVRKDHVTKP